MPRGHDLKPEQYKDAFLTLEVVETNAKIPLALVIINYCRHDAGLGIVGEATSKVAL